MRTAARAPVMADVAALAEVSTQTVSRVLNGHSCVTRSTRERVELAVTRLGYQRNTAARALVTRRSRTVGVVGTSDHGRATMLVGVEQAARSAGYSVTFLGLQQVDQASLSSAVDELTRAGVDGVVVLSPAGAVGVPPRTSGDVPVVLLEDCHLQRLPTAETAQVHAGRLATAHLLELGHRTVHHLRGPQGGLDAEGRTVGWQRELRARGAEPPECLVGDWSPASGYDAGRRLASDPDVTAVFAANDHMALGVVLALTDAGRAVPDEVSVVGFDDIPEAAYLIPPLTTVRQDPRALGRSCLRRLVAVLEDAPFLPDRPERADLVVRASTAPPPLRGRAVHTGTRPA